MSTSGMHRRPFEGRHLVCKFVCSHLFLLQILGIGRNWIKLLLCFFLSMCPGPSQGTELMEYCHLLMSHFLWSPMSHFLWSPLSHFLWAPLSHFLWSPMSHFLWSPMSHFLWAPMSHFLWSPMSHFLWAPMSHFLLALPISIYIPNSWS